MRISNGSGKSPGLNQFAFGEFRRGCLYVTRKRQEILRRLLPILRTTQSQSNGFKRVLPGRVRRFRGMNYAKKLSRRTIGRIGVSLLLAVFSAGSISQAPAANAGKGSLATITGAVLDNKGNPVSGALISLLRDGASKIIKQTRSDAAGRFSARISPGRYGIRAVAAGFNEVVFASVEVRASQELVYRFNLEPIGSGKTLPERRKDRDDVKWTLRSAQTRRSIFQAQEGEDADIQAILDGETQATRRHRLRPPTTSKALRPAKLFTLTISERCRELSKPILRATRLAPVIPASISQ